MSAPPRASDASSARRHRSNGSTSASFPAWASSTAETTSDSVARAVAERVHVASKLAEHKRNEKLARVRLAIQQAEHETDAMADGGVDAAALEENEVMSDGTSGRATWLLTCAMVEGASASEVRPLFESLVQFECDLDAVGNRMNHGKGISPLALLCSMLESRMLTPSERRTRDAREMTRDKHHERALEEADEEGALYAEKVAAIRKSVGERGDSFAQSSGAIVEFATAMLAAGASANGMYKIQPETGAIADNRIAPYAGVPGTYGSPLFFCALAIISGAGDDVLSLAARLTSRGASANAECERPGRHACCGKFLTPLNVCCAALESSIPYEMEYERKCRIAKLAGLIIQGCDDVKLNIDSTFTHRLSVEELADRRIAPVEIHTLMRGPAIFILACAIAEGVGTVAVALMDLLLEKLDKITDDYVGARSHHGRKLPLLAMVIDAIDAPCSFNSLGFIETRTWWESAAVKANVSDMGSVLGSQLSKGEGSWRALSAVDAEDLSALDEYIPDINDAAFDGRGAVARREEFETERKKEMIMTDEEIAAEAERDRKAARIAAAIAQAEKAQQNSVIEEQQQVSESEPEGDNEETLAAKGATQYTDEDGNTFVVGFTEYMMKSKSGVFLDHEDPEELKRIRAKARAARLGRFELLVETAKNVTFSLIDSSEKAIGDVTTALALAQGEEEEKAVVFNRPTQARLDCLDLAKSLLKRGANPNVRMTLNREFAHTCAETTTTPLCMVSGYIARDMQEAYPLFEMLLETNIDVNARGLGPYPIAAPPLFTLAMAIYHGVDGAEEAFEKLLKYNVSVDLKALFPDGSKGTTLIQLIHALRAGKSDRQRILRLIKQVLERGADPNLCCIEVYSEKIPEAYIEAIKITNHQVPAVTFAMMPERTLLCARAEENAQVASIVHRVRQPSMELVPPHPGEHEDLSDGELSSLDFGKVFEEVTRLKKIKESGDTDDDASVRSSMFGSVKNFDFGAPFPALPHRSGECQYPPLFWAIEAAAKEGHKEAVELVVRLLDAGAMVRRMMHKNFHSWIEGNLVAMAIAAAVEAAAPLPAPEDETNFERLNVGEVLLRLNQAANQEQPKTKETEEDKFDNTISNALEHAAFRRQSTRVYDQGEEEPSFYEKVTKRNEARILGGVNDDIDISALRRRTVLDALRPERPDDGRVYTVEEAPEDVNADTEAVPTKIVPKMSMVQGVIRPKGSRFGPASIAARRDIPGLVRTVVVGHTSFETRALEITRKENERRAHEIRQRFVNPNNTVRGGQVRSSTWWSSSVDKNVYDSDPQTDDDLEEQLQAADTKELDWAINEEEEKRQTELNRMAHGIIPKGLQNFGVKRQSATGSDSQVKVTKSGIETTTMISSRMNMEVRQNISAAVVKEETATLLTSGGESYESRNEGSAYWPSDDEFPEEFDQTEMDKLYDDVDKIGAPSEADREEQMLIEAEWESARPLTREELELRHASRQKTTLAVAIKLLEKCSADNIDAFARNPLLESYGVGLVPYEFTPLFAALYGAATAKSQEQLAVGITLAKICINKGANVDKIGLHSVLAPEAYSNARNQLKAHRMRRYKELRERYVEQGDKTALDETLNDNFVLDPERSIGMRSYPLMWAVTAAIRAEARELGCEDIVKHMLMEGADPTSISLQAIDGPRAVDARVHHGSVLYLWGTAEDLFKASQKRYQSVISTRLNIARMLSEFGARSSYRSQTNFPYIVNRTEAASAGRWLIKGKEGFGIVAAPPESENTIDRLEPFKNRVVRAMHDGAGHKRHVTIESNRERKVNSILADQGTSETFGTWIWPNKEESKADTLPPVDETRVLGFKSTAELDYVHRRFPGQIEVFAQRVAAKSPSAADKRSSYDTTEAITLASEHDVKEEAILARKVRATQISAIHAAFSGKASDVPKDIIDETLLPRKLLR